MHRSSIRRFALGLVLLGGFAATRPEAWTASRQDEERPFTIEDAVRLWKRGETLPVRFSQLFPLPPQAVPNDTGINVLVDVAHECSFWALWETTDTIRALGFRASACQATLDTALVPGRLCRIRIPVGNDWPFAWWPVSRFNVVIVNKAGHDTPEITREEREALLKFVREGGGVIVLGGAAPAGELGSEWSLNELAGELGATFTEQRATHGGKRVPVLRADPEWDVLKAGDGRGPIAIRREFGKGRAILMGSGLFDVKNEREAVREWIIWASGGSKPVGGEPTLPTERWGGGAIYPELEKRLKRIVVFYTTNAKEEILDAVEEMPAATEQLYEWLPSPEPEEPMFLIAAAGGGGGWAVNAYLPKEVGIICLDRPSFVGVFGHEQAHTMSGPLGVTGIVAANHALGGNQGEPHAGWFQGKIGSLRCVDQSLWTSNRGGNGVFIKGSDPPVLDEAVMKEWREKNFSYLVIWYIWQKLDDRYGPTWYPRWRWVQHTRWAETPGKQLSLDETVEDMSIAVGEDLFPFFRKLQSNTTKDRFAEATFMGRTMELPVAPIELLPAGKVNVRPIGDYTKPLAAR